MGQFRKWLWRKKQIIRAIKMYADLGDFDFLGPNYFQEFGVFKIAWFGNPKVGQMGGAVKMVEDILSRVGPVLGRNLN